MTNLESLRSLQMRIREATGYNRLLDLAVAQALLPGRHWTLGHPSHAPANYTPDPNGLGPCVALLEAVLPGCKWERDRCGSLRIWHPDNGAGPSIVFAPANDCLTFLYAIVGALIAQEEAKHTEKAG